MHVQDPLGFSGASAFCKWAGFSGTVTWRFVVMGYFITGASDDGGPGIAIFPEGMVNGNYPVFPVEKNVRFGLCLKIRAEFGKGHIDSFLLTIHFLILP